MFFCFACDEYFEEEKTKPFTSLSFGIYLFIYDLGLWEYGKKNEQQKRERERGRRDGHCSALSMLSSVFREIKDGLSGRWQTPLEHNDSINIINKSLWNDNNVTN